MQLLEAGRTHTEAGNQPCGDIKRLWRRVDPARCDCMQGRYLPVLRCTVPPPHARACWEMIVWVTHHKKCKPETHTVIDCFCTISLTSETVIVKMCFLRALTLLSLSAGGDADGAAARGSADWRAPRPTFQRQLPQPAPVHPRHAPGTLEEQAASWLPGVLGGPVGLRRAGSHSRSEREHGDVIQVPGWICQICVSAGFPVCLFIRSI